MKKVINYLLLFFIIIMPIYVYAKPVKSPVHSFDEHVVIEFGKVKVQDIAITRYNNLHSTGEPGFIITSSINNNYTKDLDLNYTLRVYDKDDNFIDEYNLDFTVKGGNSFIYRETVFGKNVDYDVTKVAKYSITIDGLSTVAILDKNQDNDYYFDNYEIKIKVNENNIYNIEENFLVTFNSQIEEITRGIPNRNKYVRENGKRVNKRAIVSDIEVKDYYTLSTEKGFRTLTIGKVDKTNTKKNYNIKYNYNVGTDTLKGNDEFVYYLVNNYNVSITNLNFEITMPKNFDTNNIRFIDETGMVINDIEYKVKGNVITGKIMSGISPGATIAAYILLEENYFVGASNNVSNLTITSILVSVISIVAVIIFMLLGNKLNKREYNGGLIFNKELNSLEIGYLYDAKVDDRDIASLLFHLANKGYIEIEKLKKGYKIIKVKDYLENDRAEKHFMNELFGDKKELDRNEVINSLKNVKEVIYMKMDEKNRKRKLHHYPIFNYKLIFWFLIIAILSINISNILIDYQPDAIKLNILLSSIGYIIFLNGILRSNKVIEKVLFSLVGLVLIVIPILFTSYEAYFQDVLNILAYILGIISMMIIASISFKLSNRTSYGNRMLNKIKAYKDYLVDCDTETLKKELKENSNCLYDVLPFSFALSISDKWMNKVKELNVKKPSWYKTSKFDIDEFYEDIKDIYSDIFIALKNNKV